MLGKLQRANHTLCGHFAPAFLGGSNKLKAFLFFIYFHIPESLLAGKHGYYIGVEDLLEFHADPDQKFYPDLV